MFWRKANRLKELEMDLEMALDSSNAAHEANIRLIHQLRQMDQAIFTLSQVAPNWEQMRPVIAKVLPDVERRMKVENGRIRNLMVDEIKTAYNEPKKLLGSHEGVPVYETKKLPDRWS